MSRYIDAEHLRKWILSWWERTEPTSEFLKGGDILNQIDREPSIDIVRCQDCRHRYMDADLQVWTCTYGLMIKPDGFCNYGEVRDE